LQLHKIHAFCCTEYACDIVIAENNSVLQFLNRKKKKFRKKRELNLSKTKEMVRVSRASYGEDNSSLVYENMSVNF